LILTHGGALSNLPLFLAIDAGLIAARGVLVEAPPLDGFGSTAERLRAGIAALGTTGFTQVLSDAGAPDPLVVIAGSGLRGIALVGRPGASLASLAGTVGTFGNDPMQVLLADVLDRHGLGGRVTVRLMSSLVEAADALAAGTVEAITTVEPWIFALRTAGFVLLSDGSDVWGPDFPDTVLVTRRSVLEAEPDTVIAVIDAMLEAERMIAADPETALVTVRHRFPGFTLAELRAGLAGQPPRVDLRGIEDSILGRWPTVCRLAGRPVTPAPDHLIDVRCLAAAVDATTAPLSNLERLADVH
jgi:ABC-type nitrate/sulfonate/bicarbonate transport system substrate-binding protein